MSMNVYALDLIITNHEARRFLIWNEQIASVCKDGEDGDEEADANMSC